MFQRNIRTFITQFDRRVKLCFSRNYFIIFFPFLLSVACCNEKSPSKSASIEILIDSTYIKNVNYNEKFEVIELETPPEFELFSITKVYLAGDKIVVFDSENNSVLVFSSNGEFHSKIGEIGKGAGKFAGITDINYDKENQLVQIYSIQDRMFYQFTLSGQRVSEISTPFDFLTFQKVPEGLWVYGCFEGNKNEGLFNVRNNKANLLLLSEDLKEIKSKFLESENFHDRANGNNNFQVNSNGDVFFHYGFNPTIYILHNGKPTPYLTIDFGERKFPYDYMKTLFSLKDYEWEMYRQTEPYFGHATSLQVGDSIVSFEVKGFEQNSKSDHVTAFPKKGTYKVSRRGIIFDKGPQLPPVMLDDGKAIFHINPVLLDDLDFAFLHKQYQLDLSNTSGRLLFIIDEKNIQ